MGNYLVKLADDAYLMWSPITDAPASLVHTRDDALATWASILIDRADNTGTSHLDDVTVDVTPAAIVRHNSAGPDDAELTVSQIIDAYQKHDPQPWALQAIEAARQLGRPRRRRRPAAPPTGHA